MQIVCKCDSTVKDKEQMERLYFISLYLDTRRAKSNGKYPVKLRVFTSSPRKQKLYPTNYDYNELEFDKIVNGKRIGTELKEARMTLQAYETKANNAAQELEYFTFEAFERRFFGSFGGKSYTVQHYYNELIKDYTQAERIGTANNYKYSLKSLKDFKGRYPSFSEITPQWLEDYERYVINIRDQSITTVGIYLRPLRRVFNLAIADKIIHESQYPFGQKKYVIPQPKGVKKALTHEQLAILFHSKPETIEQEKAKAFWFFSYSCNGMNIKDILNLRYKDISDGAVTFRRAKTSRTKKDSAPIKVFLTDFARDVIEKYGNKNRSANDFVFPILKAKDKAAKQHNDIKKFVRYVNQHFKKLAESVNVTGEVSTYWARHSFATNAIRQGASMEFVRDAFGHGDMTTTKNYFDGFLDETKKEITDKLMDF